MDAVAARRRLLRLVGEGRGARFTDLDDGLRAELAAWLRDRPGDCPAPVRAEVLAMVAEPASTGDSTWP
jgi:hypothetical protein